MKKETKEGVHYPLFFSPVNDIEMELKCVTSEDQCKYTHATDDHKAPSTEAMVWKSGKIREKGVYPSKADNKYWDIRVNRFTLPRYANCAEGPQQPDGLRSRTTDDPFPENSMDYIAFNQNPSLGDCGVRSRYVCSEGYYEAESSEAHLTCMPCDISGGGQLSPGGLLKYCVCPDWKAKSTGIMDALQGASVIQFRVASQNEKCFDCLNDVIIDGQHERILCSPGVNIRRCASYEYLPNTALGCQRCDEGGVPSADKASCLSCTPGQYSDGTRCLACDGRTQYCNRTGMTAPESKTLSCSEEPVNKMLVANHDSFRDNECLPCKLTCADGLKYVLAARRNESNACQDSIGGVSFYACFKTGDTTPTEGRKFFRSSYEVDTDDNQPYVKVEYCEDLEGIHKWLPEHTGWLESGTEMHGVRQCTFACKHGWRENWAKELQRRIRYAVYEAGMELRRIDLQPFLRALESPILLTPPSSYGTTMRKKATWPEGSYNSIEPTQWATTKPASFFEDNKMQWRGHLLSNTFLYVDEIMQGLNMSDIRSQLCLPAEEAYTSSTGCPEGFSIPNPDFRNDDHLTPCAMKAMANGIFGMMNAEGTNITYETVVLDASYSNILCAKSRQGNTQWIPYSLCQSCLDLQRNMLAPLARDNQRIALMANWLAPLRWKTFFINAAASSTQSNAAMPIPYNFIESSDQKKCWTAPPAPNGQYFSVLSDQTSSGVRVSIPCNLLLAEELEDRACETLFDSAYQYDRTGTCDNGRRSSPCVRCGAAAELVLSSDSAWLRVGQRSNWQPTQTICRYVCPEGNVSNPTATDYQSTPCLACNALVMNQTEGGRNVCDDALTGAVYFDAVEELASCTALSRGGIREYTPACSPCAIANQSVPRYDGILFAQESILFPNNSECLALCSPDLYRTVLRNGSETLRPIPQMQIGECRLCTDTNVIACNNSNCSAGFFLNETTCQRCNTSRCDEPGFYRTQCPANSISDSRCARCDGRRLLYNDYDAAWSRLPSTISNRALLQAALQSSSMSISRRWISARFVQGAPNNVSVFESEEGCAVACINNHVWIDFSTGLPPLSSSRRLQPHYACIPCSALGERLYSVWNSSRVFVPPSSSSAFSSAVASMQGRMGGCHLCPENTETIDGMDSMCMAKPGFGQNTYGGVPVEVVTVLHAQENGSFVTIPTTAVINSNTMPVFTAGNNQFFRCCNAHREEQLCRTFALSYLDSNYATLLQGENSMYSRCVNKNNGAVYSRKRVLLGVSPQLQQCLAGQYNHVRGSTVCFNCPLGASTRDEGMNTTDSCVCLPGHYTQRHATTGALVSCIPCGWDRQRTLSMNDSGCAACPAGQITPSETSAHCYCAEGTYLSTVSQNCTLCEAGGYCETGAQRVLCPANSWSPAGAKTRSDCKCSNGTHYGSLADPGSVCYKVPPTMRCDSGNSTRRGACVCAAGWRPVYRVSSDGLTVIERCVTECEVGQYALIDSATFEKRGCDACPLNSYSSSRQAVHPGEGRTPCTPCPPNFQTLTTGSSSPSQCECLAGVSDAAGSACGSCPANTYLNTFQRRCMPCPPGSTSPTGSVGYFSCACGKGTRAALNQDDQQTLQCKACPLHTYASSAGYSCTSCPEGMITLAKGSASMRDCVCPDGRIKHAGVCVV